MRPAHVVQMPNRANGQMIGVMKRTGFETANSQQTDYSSLSRRAALQKLRLALPPALQTRSGASWTNPMGLHDPILGHRSIQLLVPTCSNLLSLCPKDKAQTNTMALICFQSKNQLVYGVANVRVVLATKNFAKAT